MNIEKKIQYHETQLKPWHSKDLWSQTQQKHSHWFDRLSTRHLFIHSGGDQRSRCIASSSSSLHQNSKSRQSSWSNHTPNHLTEHIKLSRFRQFKPQNQRNVISWGSGGDERRGIFGSRVFLFIWVFSVVKVENLVNIVMDGWDEIWWCEVSIQRCLWKLDKNYLRV